MTPPRTFATKFVFSLLPIHDQLIDSLKTVQLDLELRGCEVVLDDLLAAWVMYQLERHLYITIQMEGQRIRVAELSHWLDGPFKYLHPELRDILFQQIRPVLTHRETIPYTERTCKVLVRHYDLTMHFL